MITKELIDPTRVVFKGIRACGSYQTLNGEKITAPTYERYITSFTELSKVEQEDILFQYSENRNTLARIKNILLDNL